MTTDKIDTQGMSFPGKSKIPSSYAPMPVKTRTIFTDEERKYGVTNSQDDTHEHRRYRYPDGCPRHGVMIRNEGVDKR